MALWALIDGQRRSVSAVEVASEGNPGLNDGLWLEGVAGFSLYAICDAGETFNSASTVFKAFRYDPDASTVPVMARAPEHDVEVGAEGIGQRGITAAFTVASPRGRICHIWDGSGVTGGNVTVTYTASMLVGQKA